MAKTCYNGKVHVAIIGLGLALKQVYAQGIVGAGSN
jgi:hypothetical protein